MELLILLVAAHFIADFYLQPKEWIDCRYDNRIRSVGLYKHILVHCVLVGLILAVTRTELQQGIVFLLTIGLSHFFIDLWKASKPTTTAYFLIDQIFHLTIIVGVWSAVQGLSWALVTQAFSFLVEPRNLIIALSYIVVCKPASILISIILKRHTNVLFKSTSTEPSVPTPNVGLESAGRWIGYIERCLTLTFLFMGHFSGVGFLVATKTIFRFGDLTKNNDRQLTEYMLMGTLLSYSIALAVGWGVMALYRYL